MSLAMSTDDPRRPAEQPAGDVAPLDMRRAMGRFTTGVAVVTTEADGEVHGMTVNSLTSVSLEPPVLLVCFNKGARTVDALLQAGRFAVSILSARQEQIARRFASRGEDHFSGLPIEYGEHAVPVVPDALAHAECDVERYGDVGDHVVVFGQVRRLCDREGLPLVFLGGRFGDYQDRGHASVPWFF
jgi:flavin reductase (DIM6/NTAB) family NADH-FMN oxidoreductase RutF